MIVSIWHRFIYRLLRIILTPFYRVRFRYSFEKFTSKYAPVFVLCNHTTNHDPLLLGLAFQRQMYFVASDHIFRWGFVSKIIQFLVDPIPRAKGSTEVKTAIQILKRIKAGANVCIFAEGNSSFSGETGSIPDSTGKLIKRSGAGLITYRLDGGYFTSPRWSKTFRRGEIRGRKIREYSPQEIGAMSADELNLAIQRDLYVNAYEEQRKNPVSYHGKRLAENLETALYLCPRCGKIGSLRSEDDRFYCSCGLDLRYTLQGFLVSQDDTSPPFDTILDWSRWQSLQISKLASETKQSSASGSIVSDAGQTLWKIERASKSTFVGEGTLRLFKDKLVLDCGIEKQFSFDLDKISEMAIHGQMVLIFSTIDRESYEIKSNGPRSAIKYLELYRALRNKESLKL